MGVRRRAFGMVVPVHQRLGERLGMAVTIPHGRSELEQPGRRGDGDEEKSGGEATADEHSRIVSHA